MPIPTEPIGRSPQPRELLDGIGAFKERRISRDEPNAQYHSENER